MGFMPLSGDLSPAIERDVPIPPKKRGKLFTVRKYPWLELKVGESFLVQKPQNRFGNSVWNAQERYGIKLSTRSVMVKGQKCTRVWRIA